MPPAKSGRLRALDGPLGNRSSTAVMLCYHSVHADGPSFLSISPDRFERQLDVMRRRGWRSGSTADLEQLAAGVRPRDRRAFLTFDDGYRDTYTQALPILRSFGFTALVFLIANKTGGQPLEWIGLQADASAYPGVMVSMQWAEVEAMAEQGFEFGSHTCRHRRLTALGDEELTQELADSRRVLKARLGRCDVLAYPFGDWDLRVALAAARAGYSFAFTLPFRGQAQSTLLSIPRLSVDHRDDPRRFGMKLTGAYRRAALGRAMPIARTLQRGSNRWHSGS